MASALTLRSASKLFNMYVIFQVVVIHILTPDQGCYMKAWDILLRLQVRFFDGSLVLVQPFFVQP